MYLCVLQVFSGAAGSSGQLSVCVADYGSPGGPTVALPSDRQYGPHHHRPAGLFWLQIRRVCRASFVSVHISITSSPSCCLYLHHWYVSVCSVLIPLSYDEMHFFIVVFIFSWATAGFIPKPWLSLSLFSLFFRMIIGVVAGLLFGRLAYYLSLLWCCVAIFVFMVSSTIRWHYRQISCFLNSIQHLWLN